MAWYDTGTVSVTNGSTTVTGSGTNFIAGAQVGEGFLGPDGRLYEIQAIVSATALTLADAYLGSTQTGQVYKIVPTQSLTADLATRVSALITDFQSVVDNAGAGKFLDGSVSSPAITFVQDQDTGLYRIGANSFGVAVAGVNKVTFNSTGANFPDDSKAVFGAGSDLQIYHDGANSYVQDVGTGDILVRTNGARVTIGTTSGEYMGRFEANSFAKLYYDNAEKLATTSTGVDVTGTVTADGLTVDGNITSTGGDLNLATLDLNAIAASKAVTAVDVFVYDTSKDSDGGAWRKRTQHTSWYNETLNTATRGSRREFPAVAVIVAEAAKVTIYDGDDPALPMWMVFNAANTTYLLRNASVAAISALNGKLTASTGTAYSSLAFYVIDFVADVANSRNTAAVYKYDGVLSNRNTTGFGYTSVSSSGAIVNNTVNDVAMTVLPDAPIDPATGLPVPTIAVATAGGVSVIKDDGTVVDLTSSTYPICTKVAFLSGNKIASAFATGAFLSLNDIPSADDAGSTTLGTAATNSERFIYNSSVSSFPLSVTYHHLAQASGDLFPYSHNKGLGLLKRSTTLANSMVAYTTSTYNTGWMNGDIKGAFLSDTDTTSLVGSGELVTNGDFATNDLTGWTDISLGTGTVSAATGAARLTGTDTSNRGWVNTSFSTVVGKPYVVTFEVTADAGGLISLGVGTSSGSVGTLDFGVAGVGVYTKTFVASATTMHVNFRTTNVTDMTVDNISVKLADADRSVNNKGLIVNGTVTRSPVATGAELVAYSGFSSSNYLEQPYNSALDFGTGDFCVMGWVNVASDTWGIIVDRYTGSGGRFTLGYTPSGSNVVAEFWINGNRVQGSKLLNAGWRHVTLARRSGVASLYVDGVFDISATLAHDVSNTSATLLVGKRYDNVQQADQLASLALLRISATAPTAEQIKKIYEDEKVLFQENAACTLYGTSDAVTALAHDSDTGLLHVGTSAGRSVFQGLRRVSNTTTAVGTAISASNGLVVEE